MAQISYDAIPQSATTGGNGGNTVDFFGLRNDGDEALVRIMHDSVESFQIFAIHDRISVGGKLRKVNCIRDAKEPVDNCPLCASGNGVGYRIFINMLQYTKDAEGKTVAKPVVWERSVSYATRLNSLITEYGPLSDCLFKIKRNGAAGSMDTTYDILFCNPKVYRDDLYPKTGGEVFQTYSALGTIVLNKNFSELQQFLATGQFPQTQQQNTAQPSADSYQPKAAEPAAIPAPQYSQVPPVIPDQPPFDPPYSQTGAPASVPAAPTAAPSYAPVPGGAPSYAPPATTVTAPVPGQPQTATPGRPSPRYY